MEWTVVLAGPARKSLKRIPAGVLAALARCRRIHFKATSANCRAFRDFAGEWATGESYLRSWPNGSMLWSLQLCVVLPPPTDHATTRVVASACFAAEEDCENSSMRCRCCSTSRDPSTPSPIRQRIGELRSG
jgi:hypothetical protein